MKKSIEASMIIRASADDVWRIITDTRLWPKWGPSIREVRCLDRFIKSGSVGYVQVFFGLWLPFEVTDCIFKKQWIWRIGWINATGHRVERMSQDKCRLVFDMPVFMAPYWFVCAIAVRRIRQMAEKVR